jgi:hypothetical protein
MTKQIGRRVQAALAFESSRGAGKTPTLGLGKVEYSFYDKTMDARDDESIGHIADSKDKYVVEKYAQGSISGYLDSNNALFLLGAALGTTPTVGSPSDSVYPWTLALQNDNAHASLALLVKDANATFMHKLVMIEQLQLEIDTEGLVRFNAEFIAKKAVVSTASIPTYVEGYKFTKRKSKIYVATDISGLAAATRLGLRTFTLTINKNLRRDSQIGTVEPVDINNQEISIEGELSLNLNDQTYHDYMTNGDRKAMRLAMTSERVIGTSAFGTVEIDLPKVDFFNWEPESGNAEILPQTINFKANYDLTNGLIESATVGNAVTSIS